MSLEWDNLSPEKRMIKSKISLSSNYPFYSKILYNLQICEADGITTAAIDKYGNVYYNPEWISELSMSEIKGLLLHESLHLILLSYERQNDRDNLIWNIAQDAIINYIILEEIKDKKMKDVELPEIIPENITDSGEEETAIIPDGDSIEIGGIKITALDNETSESIYDKIDKNKVTDVRKTTLDEHIKNTNQNKENCNVKIMKSNGKEVEVDISENSRLEDEEKDPKKIYRQAKKEAERNQGKVPGDVVEIIEDTKKSQINWKRILHSKIRNYDNQSELDWTRPHKKSHDLGIFRPDTKGEKLKVNLAIDTSSSISKENLQEFLGEVLSIVNSSDNIELRIIQHDSRIQSIENYKNAIRHNLIKEIGFEVKGRGGTNHEPVFEELSKHKYDKRILILLTDGYTTVPDSKPNGMGDVIWILNNYEADREKLFGDVLVSHPEE